MFEGVYSNMNNESIADYGARRTLGISGSLTGYINTGNSYDSRFYNKASGRDSFISRKKSKNKLMRIIAPSIALAASIAGIFALIKTKKFNLNSLGNIKNYFSALTKKATGKVVKQQNEFVQSCFEGFNEFGHKIVK